MAKERRGKGEGSIYEDSRGRWVYAVDLGWSGGRRVRRTVTASTKTALRPKINALNKQLEAGMTNSTPTVEAWLTYWLDEIAPQRVTERTMKGYRGYVSTWLVPYLGKHRLDQLTAAHIRSLHKTMHDAGKSPATVRQAHAILSRALRVAMDDGKIIRNPCTSAELPRNTAKGSHGKLTLADAQKVVDYLRTRPPDVRSRWVVAIQCGLRQGEALGLPWDAVDLPGRRIYVDQAQQRINHALTITGVKSKTSHRIVPIPAEAYAALMAWAACGTSGMVWGPRDNKTDWREWQNVLADAGVERATVHAARATCASILAAAGVPSKVISEILGHSTPIITEQAYVHGDAVMHRDALDAGDRLLAGG